MYIVDIQVDIYRARGGYGVYGWGARAVSFLNPLHLLLSLSLSISLSFSLCIIKRVSSPSPSLPLLIEAGCISVLRRDGAPSSNCNLAKI